MKSWGWRGGGVQQSQLAGIRDRGWRMCVSVRACGLVSMLLRGLQDAVLAQGAPDHGESLVDFVVGVPHPEEGA
eukprot:4682456-Alexandrium_andersonii.AAC.1